MHCRYDKKKSVILRSTHGKCSVACGDEESPEIDEKYGRIIMRKH